MDDKDDPFRAKGKAGKKSGEKSHDMMGEGVDYDAQGRSLNVPDDM